ncbi:MAG: DUF72 domain-containing protein [Verrucomicrobiota bacterium]
MALYLGTSGWTYPHWQKAFFPTGLPSTDRLHFYAQRFNTVEINTTFYGTPKPATVRAWREAVPESFRFAVKASRFITHLRRLLQPVASSRKFFRAIEPLAGQVAAVLFQLPATFRADAPRLKAFLGKMPKDYRYVFEFRHPSWFCDEVYDLLRGAGAALCWWDLKGAQSPREMTADFLYLRLHGPQAAAYRGSYPDAQLKEWRRRLLPAVRARKDILVYFDNDEKGYAPLNALGLAELMKRRRRAVRASR